MAVRRRFFAEGVFEENGRRTLLAGSVLDDEWIDRLLELPPPYCVIIEGVLMYLPEADVRRLIDRLGERLPGATLLFDALTPDGVATQSKHDTLKHFAARFDWGVEDVRTVADWRPGRPELRGRGDAEGDRRPQRRPDAVDAQTDRPRHEHRPPPGGEGVLAGEVRGGVIVRAASLTPLRDGTIPDISGRPSSVR